MACLLYELVSSGDLTVGRNDAGITGEFIAVGSSDPAAVYAAAIQQTPRSYFGLYRNSVKCKPRGGAYYDVSVEYKDIPAEEAQGEQADGQTSQQASSPANDDASLGAGYTFSTAGGTVHVTQSLKTTNAIAAAGVTLPATGRAIGVTRDSVEGCDKVIPVQEFSREVRRTRVNLKYYNALVNLTGTVNKAPFYTAAAGEALYMGAEGKFASKDGWVITHKWSVIKNEKNYTVSDGLSVPLKKGWEYLWVMYQDIHIFGYKVKKAIGVFTEQIYKETDFALLEIGT